jgi:hypothetical protein
MTINLEIMLVELVARGHHHVGQSNVEIKIICAIVIVRVVHINAELQNWAIHGMMASNWRMVHLR